MTDDLPRDTSTWLGEAMQAASDAYRAEHGWTPMPLDRMGNTERKGWAAAVRAVDPPDDSATDMRTEIPAPDAERYALVEQMGFRHVTGTVRETELVGKKMLEVTDLATGQVRLVGGDSLYQVTWLTKDLAEIATRTGAHAVAAIAAATEADESIWGDGYPDSEREMDALAHQRSGDDERDDQ